jgi:hypothetical protein
MALVLANCETWKIMLTGRWKSMAFLEYIREQVQELHQNTSTSMIQNPSFFTLPDSNEQRKQEVRSQLAAAAQARSQNDASLKIMPNFHIPHNRK